MSQHPQVLIAGAGPTGLTVAIELVRRGVACRLVERRTARAPESKALVVHARTLELMDVLGIADRFVARGYPSPGIDFSATASGPDPDGAAGGAPVRADMHGLDTRFPYILILPQAETEELLEAHLAALGGRVERGVELTAFRADAAGVHATLRRVDGAAGGAEEAVDAEYLVGADGAHSLVRRTLGIPFEGSEYAWTAFLGDVRVEGHDAEGGTEQYSNARGLAFVVPFQDGSQRIVTIDRKYQGGPRQHELRLEDLQESARAILERPVTLHDPRWLTRWGAELRQAARYRGGSGPAGDGAPPPGGRAFLAGDAAHTHSPAGGQGMNTGVQDAFNLGWKLAAVLQGWGPPTLLDTYEAERHPVGRRVLRESDLLLRSLLVEHGALRAARERLVRALVPLPPVQRVLSEGLSGLGVHYPTGTGALAGRRVPEVTLADAAHRDVRLYERLRGPRYALFVYAAARQVEDGGGRAALDAWVARAAAAGVPAHVVLDAGLPDRHHVGADVLVDARGEFGRKLGARPGLAVLARPDAYVAASVPDFTTHDPAPVFGAWTSGAGSSRPAGAPRGRLTST